MNFTSWGLFHSIAFKCIPNQTSHCWQQAYIPFLNNKFSYDVNRTPFTDPPIKRTKRRKHHLLMLLFHRIVFSSEKWRLKSSHTPPPKRRPQLLTFHYFRPILFPLKSGACVIAFFIHNICTARYWGHAWNWSERHLCVENKAACRCHNSITSAIS